MTVAANTSIEASQCVVFFFFSSSEGATPLPPPSRQPMCEHRARLFLQLQPSQTSFPASMNGPLFCRCRRLTSTSTCPHSAASERRHTKAHPAALFHRGQR